MQSVGIRVPMSEVVHSPKRSIHRWPQGWYWSHQRWMSVWHSIRSLCTRHETSASSLKGVQQLATIPCKVLGDCMMPRKTPTTQTTEPDMIRLAIMAPASTMGDLRNTTPSMDPLVICGALSRVWDSLAVIPFCMLCSYHVSARLS